MERERNGKFRHGERKKIIEQEADERAKKLTQQK